MPWSGSSFRERHNKGLSSGQATHAAHIANAILRRGEPEGIAIATANRMVERGFGGLIPHYQSGGTMGLGAVGGPPPGVQTMQPNVQGLIQQYGSMSPEQLQELLVRVGPNSPYGQLAQRILMQKRIMPNVGATAAPQQGDVPTYQSGGVMSPSEATPWWSRSMERTSIDPRGGFLHSPVAGRTDHISAQPPAGSYVIPADVTSGIGSGNSIAGAKFLEMALETGPHGTRMPHMGGVRSPLTHMPSPPSMPRAYQEGLDSGGKTKGVKCLLAGGEYVIPPGHVRRLGGGDIRKGHRVLDLFVVNMRKKIIEEMKRLPPPKK